MADKAPSASYPIAVIVQLLDLSVQRVHQLVAEGVLVKTERGRFDLVRSVQGYIKFLRQRALKADASQDSWSDRKRRAATETAEMELAILKGEYAPLGELKEMIALATSIARSKLYAIPTKLAPRLHDGLTIAQKEAMIRAEIDKAMESLSALAKADRARINKAA
jgi:phage terminase Nu1 subunit (DNA packaging protein)